MLQLQIFLISELFGFAGSGTDDDGDDDDIEEEDGDEQMDAAAAGEAGASEEDDGSADRCPVCLCPFRGQDVGTPESCDHTFCLDCIQEWAKVSNTVELRIPPNIIFLFVFFIFFLLFIFISGFCYIAVQRWALRVRYL